MTAGACERCASYGRTGPGEVHAYWGPFLCRPCAVSVAALLDEHDRWPPVPWGEADKELIG